MATIQRTFEVPTDPTQVLDYLKDFSHATEWDPGTESCTRVDRGLPIAVGSRWHNTSKLAGVTTELEYEIAELTADRVVFVGRNDSATSTDTISVSPSSEHPGGSRVTYHADIEMSGAAKMADPLVKVFFERVGSEVEDNLVRELSALPSG